MAWSLSRYYFYVVRIVYLKGLKLSLEILYNYVCRNVVFGTNQKMLQFIDKLFMTVDVKIAKKI